MKRLTTQEVDRLVTQRQALIEQLRDRQGQNVIAACRINDRTEEGHAIIMSYHEKNDRMDNVIERIETSIQRLEALQAA